MIELINYAESAGGVLFYNTVGQCKKVVVSGTVIDVDGKPVTEGTVQVYVDDLAGW